MSVLRGTVFVCLLAVAGLGEEGAWTANRMPGTNVLWTAARTSNEVERVRRLVETGAVTRTEAAGWETGSHAGLATTGDVASLSSRVDATNAALAAAIHAATTNEAALREAGDAAGIEALAGTNAALAAAIHAAATNEAALRAAGDAAGIEALAGTNAALAAAIHAAATNALAALGSHTNDAAIHLTPAQADGIELALTNRVTKLYDSTAPGMWSQIEGGTNVVVYSLTVTGTNYIISGTFIVDDGPTLTLTNAPLPFASAPWRADVDGGFAVVSYGGISAWTADTSGGFPVTLVAGYEPPGYSGGGIVDIVSHTYATNVLYRYPLRSDYATTQHVAEAIAEIPSADMSAKVDVTAGIATNLTTRGWFALPQSEATNLVLRLVSSNEHIIVQEVYQ